MDDKLLKHGRFSWNELMTTDVEGARNFYGKLFGWQYEGFPTEKMTYEVVHAGGEETGGIMPIPPQAEGHPPTWGIYVTVDDVDASVKLAEALGGTIHVPPADIPGVGRFAMLQDPQGAYISIITYEKE
jgi:predicted enzyme related to lactoylglutathione lyase